MPPRGLHNQMRGTGEMGSRYQKCSEREGTTPLGAPEWGGSSVWGQDRACVPGIPSFTCGLLMRFNAKKTPISKMCLDHRNVYMVECHLESNQSTFMVENTHQVTQCELLYFHSAFKDKECPMNWAIFPAVLMLYFSKRQKLFPL